MARMKVENIVTSELQERVGQLQLDIGRRVIGSERIVRFMLIAILTENHILLEGVPGLAKTKLANEFARHLGLDFKRIQFTPDMLPTDVMGNYVLNLQTRKMEFREGPVFTNVLLADEINRTPPKVQSALLESMEERQVSSNGEMHPLPEPFFVIATQNPIEQEGTFPLAEALLDRFLFRYRMTYPDRQDEIKAVRSSQVSEGERKKYFSAGEITALRETVSDVYVSDEVSEYMVDLIRHTRESKGVFLGASPRTSVKYVRAVKANALLSGRDYAIPDDVKHVAHEMLNHRLILQPEMHFESESDPHAIMSAVINEIIKGVKVPR